ncbi:hypothetical protein [Streptomyces phaeochromogenes]
MVHGRFRHTLKEGQVGVLAGSEHHGVGGQFLELAAALRESVVVQPDALDGDPARAYSTADSHSTRTSSSNTSSASSPWAGIRSGVRR